MIQQQRQRIEQAVTEMIDDMDKTHLRKMQTDMHLCAAKCCQDTNSSVDSVQRCVDRCSQPLTKAQNYVQHELGEFQGRLQRCVMQCNDDIKVKMPANPSEDDIAKFTDQFERCAVKCVDKHVGLIPNMMKTMKSVLSRGPEAIPQFGKQTAMISEEQQNRIQEAISKMIHDMYKTHLRKMQSNMHLCAVNCCDDLTGQPSLDSVQSCIEDCAIPMMRAQDYVQHELGIFQTRLQNCLMQCNDDVRGTIPFKTHESDIAKYRYQFETCTMKCVDKHLGLIPSMMRTIKTVLANGPDNIKQA